MKKLACFVSLSVLLALKSLATPEAFEVGPKDADKLPKGKEADGIIGDFVLRNDKVEALVSCNAPLRRANMSTFYGPTGITPGCLYDLSLRGADNDQIVIFAPSGQQGPVSWVRVVEDGEDGEAVVETVITAANNHGLYKRHEYRLRDGWQGLLIVTTLRNEGKEPRKGSAADQWTKFTSAGVAAGITWADSEDPADKCGYAYGWVEVDGTESPPKEVELGPGEEITFGRFLAVGRSPAEAVGGVLAVRGLTGNVHGAVSDQAGKPVRTARIDVAMGDANVPAYPDDTGGFNLRLPSGDYELVASDLGRDSVVKKLNVNAMALASPTPAAFLLGAESAIAFDIRDDKGKTIPCKAQFIGLDATKTPDLGPKLRAHGCVDQYHSERGDFRVQIPPGSYKVIVTRGIEFSHLEQTVKVEPGQTANVTGTLKRLVDTTGWVSCDYHNHSTPSGDNTCGTPDRIINLAAEHIEFAPTTEHNRLFDWRPTIEKLGLSEEIQTVKGIELTGPGAHFNSFPFEPEPFTQDWGAPIWNKDPRISAITLRNHQGENPQRWIQINHPDMVEDFIDRDGDGRPDGGFLALGELIDGLETQNGNEANILSTAPFRVGRGRDGKESVNYLREFIWLQLLNRGARYSVVAVCDAHSVHGNGVGGWRVYVPSSTDEPAKIDWQENVRNAKAGRIILTSGPFLEVKTDDGTIAGGTTRGAGSINLQVRVQCTDWIDIDRVQVLVNGRQRSDLNFTRKSHPKLFKDGVIKFDEKINVALSEDSHLIVVAMGENFDLKTGYGTSDQSKMHPCAYNNPIYVDVDGNGFTPNGDTLGWPLPTKRLSVAEVKAMLGK